MKKFFALFLTILLFSFTLFAADFDLRSNLTFTFEPSTTTTKSLTIIPFADFDPILGQEKTVEKKKESDLPIILGIWAMIVVQFALLY